MPSFLTTGASYEAAAVSIFTAPATETAALSRCPRPAMDLLSHKRSTQLIHTALETYNPATDAIAVVFFAQQPLVVQLTQMQVPPEEAFRQVKHRRDEFNLS